MTPKELNDLEAKHFAVFHSIEPMTPFTELDTLEVGFVTRLYWRRLKAKRQTYTLWRELTLRILDARHDETAWQDRLLLLANLARERFAKRFENTKWFYELDGIWYPLPAAIHRSLHDRASIQELLEALPKPLFDGHGISSQEISAFLRCLRGAFDGDVVAAVVGYAEMFAESARSDIYRTIMDRWLKI